MTLSGFGDYFAEQRDLQNKCKHRWIKIKFKKD